MSSEPNKTKSDKAREVPWSDVVRFVRQLSHDLRNHLNAIELQSAYLAELAGQAEVKSEVKRLREMTAQIGATLHKLTEALGQPKPQTMAYRAADFVEDLKQRLETDFPKVSASVDWTIDLGEEVVAMDPQLLQQAVIELFLNADQHERGGGDLSFTASVGADGFVMTLREPKKDFRGSTENWGAQPLHKVGPGHYGLGLHRARVIIESHRGQLQTRYDSATSALSTTIRLPSDGG